ncbi:MAG: methylmalonyl Co-A mutase-associated GTPase MeaB [Myxococcota bacterium]
MRAPRRDDLVAGVRAGDRALLARAITLVESALPAHATLAQEVLGQLLPDTGGALRIGISGVPGVGKSTFIDAFGTLLTEAGHRVAVLAVDPTSSVSGGSILGDKTRMQRLARDARAYIRPSPTSGSLGGVARKSRETLLLCEAAGFDVVLVETVGVGQSETVVSEMVDFYLVLMLAGAGDELQGIKRGILEVADMLAINKADGDNVLAAERAKRDYAAALHLMRGARAGWQPPVQTCSGRSGEGLAEIWAEMLRYREEETRAGRFAARREDQQVRWLWSLVDEGVKSRLRGSPEQRARLAALEAAVRSGETTAVAAAARVLATLGLR